MDGWEKSCRLVNFILCLLSEEDVLSFCFLDAANLALSSSIIRAKDWVTEFLSLSKLLKLAPKLLALMGCEDPKGACLVALVGLWCFKSNFAVGIKSLRAEDLDVAASPLNIPVIELAGSVVGVDFLLCDLVVDDLAASLLVCTTVELVDLLLSCIWEPPAFLPACFSQHKTW